MPDSTDHTHSTGPYRDPAQPLQRRVEDLLQRMTLEEKIAQLQAGWPMCYGYAVRDGRVTLNPELEATLAPATLGQFAALLRTDPWFGIPVERALDRRQGAELVNAVQRYVRETASTPSSGSAAPSFRRCAAWAAPSTPTCRNGWRARCAPRA